MVRRAGICAPLFYIIACLQMSILSWIKYVNLCGNESSFNRFWYFHFLKFNIFVALTLKDKKSEVWDPEAKGAEDYQGGHKLIIKQALLGPEAAEGSFCLNFLLKIKIWLVTRNVGNVYQLISNQFTWCFDSFCGFWFLKWITEVTEIYERFSSTETVKNALK